MSAGGIDDVAEAAALLASARSLLDRDPVAGQGPGATAELGGAASRGAALLGRSALEEGIWTLFPQLRAVSGRAMLLTLPFVFDRRAARTAAVAWSRLSAVTHHHVYEMPPTVAEVTAMLDAVDDVLAVIRSRMAKPTRAPST